MYLFFFEVKSGNKAVAISHHALLPLMQSPEVLHSVCRMKDVSQFNDH